MQVRRSLAAAVAVGSLFLVTACAGDDLDEPSGSDDESSAPADQGTVNISGQSFTEAAIVAAMYDELLTDAGYTTNVKLVDTRDAYMATFPGDVDVVPEYVGGIVNFLNARENGAKAEPFEAGDGAELAEQGKALLDSAGITLLDTSEATDTNAFFVTQEYSDSEGVTKLSDLEGESVVLAAAPDCEGRLDCEGGLSDQYGIDITKVLPLGFASPQTYEAVLSGEADLGQTGTTDGTLESQGLVLLEDDQGIQPAQNLTPAVNAEFLEANPDLEDLFNELSSALTTEDLAEMNAAVDVERQKPEDVAREFLEDKGLI